MPQTSGEPVRVSGSGKPVGRSTSLVIRARSSSRTNNMQKGWRSRPASLPRLVEPQHDEGHPMQLGINPSDVLPPFDVSEETRKQARDICSS